MANYYLHTPTNMLELKEREIDTMDPNTEPIRQTLTPDMIRSAKRRHDGQTDQLSSVPQEAPSQYKKREKPPIETAMTGRGVQRFTEAVVEAAIPAGFTADWLERYAKQGTGGRTALTLAGTLAAAGGYYESIQFAKLGRYKEAGFALTAGLLGQAVALRSEMSVRREASRGQGPVSQEDAWAAHPIVEAIPHAVLPSVLVEAKMGSKVTKFVRNFSATMEVMVPGGYLTKQAIESTNPDLLHKLTAHDLEMALALGAALKVTTVGVEGYDAAARTLARFEDNVVETYQKAKIGVKKWQTKESARRQEYRTRLQELRDKRDQEKLELTPDNMVGNTEMADSWRAFNAQRGKLAAENLEKARRDQMLKEDKKWDKKFALADKIRSPIASVVGIVDKDLSRQVREGGPEPRFPVAPIVTDEGQPQSQVEPSKIGNVVDTEIERKEQEMLARKKEEKRQAEVASGTKESYGGPDKGGVSFAQTDNNADRGSLKDTAKKVLANIESQSSPGVPLTMDVNPQSGIGDTHWVEGQVGQVQPIEQAKKGLLDRAKGLWNKWTQRGSEDRTGHLPIIVQTEDSLADLNHTELDPNRYSSDPTPLDSNGNPVETPAWKSTGETRSGTSRKNGDIWGSSGPPTGYKKGIEPIDPRQTKPMPIVRVQETGNDEPDTSVNPNSVAVSDNGEAKQQPVEAILADRKLMAEERHKFLLNAEKLLDPAEFQALIDSVKDNNGMFSQEMLAKVDEARRKEKPEDTTSKKQEPIVNRPKEPFANAPWLRDVPLPPNPDMVEKQVITSEPLGFKEYQNFVQSARENNFLTENELQELDGYYFKDDRHEIPIYIKDLFEKRASERQRIHTVGEQITSIPEGQNISQNTINEENGATFAESVQELDPYTWFDTHVAEMSGRDAFAARNALKNGAPIPSDILMTYGGLNNNVQHVSDNIVIRPDAPSLALSQIGDKASLEGVRDQRPQATEFWTFYDRNRQFIQQLDPVDRDRLQQRWVSEGVLDEGVRQKITQKRDEAKNK